MEHAITFSAQLEGFSKESKIAINHNHPENIACYYFFAFNRNWLTQENKETLKKTIAGEVTKCEKELIVYL